jgi:tRNA threonylcarbamoyladenosine biosynthesis protein TsaE
MTSVKNALEMIAIGERLGKVFRGGEVLELVGDVGAGKTTLVKGIGAGMRVDDDVQSPSFTISRIYEARDGLSLHHYDFYRLSDAGIMSYDLAESVDDPRAVTIIEWADTVAEVLPAEHILINIEYEKDGEGRMLTITIPERYNYLENV